MKKDKVLQQKFWKQLVRVVENIENKKYFLIIIPGWDINKKVKIYKDSFPQELLLYIKYGTRLHAKVNIGVKDYHELCFKDWQVDR